MSFLLNYEMLLYYKKNTLNTSYNCSVEQMVRIHIIVGKDINDDGVVSGFCMFG